MSEEFCLETCSRSAPENVVFLAPIDPSADAGEIVREAAKADLIAAFHEAGHLVVGLLLGMEPADIIVVGGQGLVAFHAPPPSQEADLAMTLAGEFAEGLANRHEHRPMDAELTPYLNYVRQNSDRFDDQSHAFRMLLLEHGFDAPNDVILASYRQAEAHTLEILRRLDVRAAIRAVADALMKTGRLAGDEAAEIARRFITPGELLTEKEIFHEAD